MNQDIEAVISKALYGDIKSRIYTYSEVVSIVEFVLKKSGRSTYSNRLKVLLVAYYLSFVHKDGFTSRDVKVFLREEAELDISITPRITELRGDGMIKTISTDRGYKSATITSKGRGYISENTTIDTRRSAVNLDSLKQEIIEAIQS